MQALLQKGVRADGAIACSLLPKPFIPGTRTFCVCESFVHTPAFASSYIEVDRKEEVAAMGYAGAGFTSTGAILVLFILLVIISRTILVA